MRIPRPPSGHRRGDWIRGSHCARPPPARCGPAQNGAVSLNTDRSPLGGSARSGRAAGVDGGGQALHLFGKVAAQKEVRAVDPGLDLIGQVAVGLDHAVAKRFVAAGDGDWNGLGLDGSGRDVVFFCERTRDWIGKAEILKGGQKGIFL